MLPSDRPIRVSLIDDGAVLRVERWEGACDVPVPVDLQQDASSVEVEFGVPFSLEAEWRRITGSVCPAVAQMMVSDIELPHPVTPGTATVRIVGLLPDDYEQAI